MIQTKGSVGLSIPRSRHPRPRRNKSVSGLAATVVLQGLLSAVSFASLNPIRISRATSLRNSKTCERKEKRFYCQREAPTSPKDHHGSDRAQRHRSKQIPIHRRNRSPPILQPQQNKDIEDPPIQANRIRSPQRPPRNGRIRSDKLAKNKPRH